MHQKKILKKSKKLIRSGVAFLISTVWRKALPGQPNNIPDRRNRYFISTKKQNRNRRKHIHRKKICREAAQQQLLSLLLLPFAAPFNALQKTNNQKIQAEYTRRKNKRRNRQS